LNLEDGTQKFSGQPIGQLNLEDGTQKFSGQPIGQMNLEDGTQKFSCTVSLKIFQIFRLLSLQR
jgi:K+/H+ antiporter YhaU regulatory subunit KhtT